MLDWAGERGQKLHKKQDFVSSLLSLSFLFDLKELPLKLRGKREDCLFSGCFEDRKREGKNKKREGKTPFPFFRRCLPKPFWETRKEEKREKERKRVPKVVLRTKRRRRRRRRRRRDSLREGSNVKGSLGVVYTDTTSGASYSKSAQ